MENDESPELKVVDKRRFSESGEVRQGVDEKAEQKPVESRGAKVSKQNESSKVETGSGGQSTESVPVDFSSFVVSLATQAMVMLGEIPNPESNARLFNPEAVRQTIDILAMLNEKTTGNLTKDEDMLIEEVLASLRIAYVNKINASKSTSQVG